MNLIQVHPQKCGGFTFLQENINHQDSGLLEVAGALLKLVTHTHGMFPALERTVQGLLDLN